MILEKSSLCNLLLENGEENLAVLLARSELPESLDLTRDAPLLREIGLAEDVLESLLPAVVGSGGVMSEREAARIRRTISVRWATLVDKWTETDKEF